MPSTINASTAAGGGIISSADSSGVLELQTAGTTALTVNSSQQVTFSQAANLPNTFGFKNRIINGAMTINQRGGIATINSAVYSLDRWLGRSPNSAGVFTIQQSSTAPTGFNSSLLATVTTASSVGASDLYFIQQRIEGYNIADLGFGTANAKTITLSFWVQSSLTGTFGGSVGNNIDQSYPFSFTISSANTWTQVSLTIAGSTTGTWNTTNATGLLVSISMGTGSSLVGTANSWGNYPYAPTGSINPITTSGTTFYITGVQLEKGSTATSFDYRSIGTELSLCLRYFERFNYPGGDFRPVTVGQLYNTNGVHSALSYSTKRSAPTVTGSAASHFACYIGTSLVQSSVINYVSPTLNTVNMNPINLVSLGVANAATLIVSNNTATVAFINIDSEL